MNLGISGRRAVVCGGSKGLGFAAARSLALEGVHLTLVARSADALAVAARTLRDETGVDVETVAADLATEAGRAAVLERAGTVDILLANPGIRQVPEDFRTLSLDAWHGWMDAHCFSSLELIRAVTPGMCERRFGRIVNMSVSFIKFPQVGFAQSHAARLALAGAIAAIARELIPHNVVINSVCPGLFETDALITNLHGHAQRGNTTYEAIVADRLRHCPAGRFADPAECGDLIAFLCSAQNGFMTAQNIVNDGGVYQGLF
ncbi:3-oxoacyl-[acyl-carrier protein] reductase [Paraburkholderia caballeronis]|uniref:SDR family oxidoreductase n=1 Tax=Paraburkholderia caballeronis TaxID=416943 RepID=UPI00106503D7|nr:SDR family oxidoreductase [Paraburkholderia caballeronis]TDV33618.1 3-oxoacyl-[acyl-carrier protein] reductase [Paraburkholderia caballeronis]